MNIRRCQGSGSFGVFYPEYLVTAAEDGQNNIGGQFLMRARRRKKSSAPNYLISVSEEDLSNDSPSVIAKGKAMESGGLISGKPNAYTVYTNGDNPKDFVVEKNVREELAYLEFEPKQ